MELWLRHRTAARLEWDERHDVGSQEEWHDLVYDPAILSSILWPTPPRFEIRGPHFRRRHPHERGYRNDPQRNGSYRAAAESLASRLRDQITGSRTLVYAPLRGALPIWRAIERFFAPAEISVYFPVTSSFVFFPEEYGIRNRKGRNASGRFNHVLELQRLRPFLSEVDHLVYLDEIVSGGMMLGYLRDLVRLGIHRQVRIVAAGLADRFGQRSRFKRRGIEELVASGKVERFLWQGCQELITEDQKFLLGIHYVDYTLGPHVVPVLDRELGFFREKRQFDAEVMTASG